MSAQAFLRWSVAVALTTLTLKMLAWWVTGSVGLLSDAIESLVNVAGALFALLMVTIARRPPDEGHPYGHHKAEYFSSGFEGLLILVAAMAIIYAALRRLADPQPIDALALGMALTVVASALNAALAWRMLRAASALRSIALEADARHLMTDVWTSAGVIVGLIGVRLTGWSWLDPAIAIAVALNIAREGLSLAARSVNGLMDKALEPEVLGQIDAVLRRFDDPAIRFDHLVTRRAGARRFIELHLHVPATWELGRAAALRSAVEAALMAALPGLRPTIQLLPSVGAAHSEAAEPG